MLILSASPPFFVMRIYKVFRSFSGGEPYFSVFQEIQNRYKSYETIFNNNKKERNPGNSLGSVLNVLTYPSFEV